MKIHTKVLLLCTIFFAILLESKVQTTITEGNIKKDGFWPFLNYKISFPTFLFEKKIDAIFSVPKIWSNDKVWVTANFNSDQAIHFDDLDINIAFEFFVKNKEIFFKTEKNLLSHYQKMRQVGKALWPEKNEWVCEFYWNKEVADRATPFSTDTPKKSDNLRCKISLPNPKSKFFIRMKNYKETKTKVPVNVEIVISSSWK